MNQAAILVHNDQLVIDISDPPGQHLARVTMPHTATVREVLANWKVHTSWQRFHGAGGRIPDPPENVVT